MREIETDFQINHRLTNHAEAEVPGLDDARMDRPDRNLVHALASNRQKGKRRAVILELSGLHKILAERKIIFGPEGMAHQRTGVGMVNGFNAEEVLDLALEARGGVVERRHR